MRYTKLPEGVCRHLLAKKMLYPSSEGEPRPAYAIWNTSYHWCNVTQRDCGPDGDIVNEKECTCARPCWQSQKPADLKPAQV